MKYFYLLLLSVIGFLLPNTSLAQISIDPNGQSTAFIPLPTDKIIPPSPEAASLGKYGQYPVDLSTGVPNIEIPIYTIKSKQLELPITLTYHASGIKVNEVASWVGLGWSLNAGGIISISTRGLPDCSDRNYQRLGHQRTAAYFNTLGNNQNIPALFDLYKGGDYIDTQADMYYYNVAGLGSGAFTFTVNGTTLQNEKVIQMPETDNKIERTYTGEANKYNFKITSANGTQYFFNTEDHEYTTTQSTDINTAPVYAYTALYLSKIVSADGKDQITFIYDKNSSSTKTNRYLSFTVSKSYQINQESCTLGPIMNEGGIKEVEQYHTVKNYPLKEIVFTGGRVLFNCNKNRQDKGNFILESIQVIADDRIESHQPYVLSANFSYDYFISSHEHTPGIPESYKRLKLNKIQFSSPQKTIQEYSFSYNSLILPNYTERTVQGVYSSGDKKRSLGQDLWGYYNGISDNNCLFENTVGWKVASNRNISEYNAKACMLEKITFPTGGYTEFVFESNKIKYPSQPTESYTGGLRIKEINSYDQTGTLLEKKNYVYENGMFTNPPFLQNYSYTQATNEPCSSQLSPVRIHSSTQILHSNPVVPQGPMGGNPVIYTKVTEHFTNGLVNAGKKEYDYLFMEDSQTYTEAAWNAGIGGGSPRYPYYFLDNSWRRGQLLEERNYKKTSTGYDTVSKIKNNYVILQKNSPLYTVGTFIDRRVTSSDNYNYVSNHKKSDYFFFDILFETGITKLESTTLTEYVNGQPSLTQTTNYEYGKALASLDNDRHYQPTKITTIKSNGDKLLMKYKYPIDFLSSTYTNTDYLVAKAFRDANIKAIPFEQVNYLIKSGTTTELATSGRFYKYGTINQLKEVLQIESTSPFAYTGANINSSGFVLSSNYKTLATFDLYNQYNNLLQYTKKDGLKTSFLWGYDGLYPIAKIENADFNTVANVLGGALEVNNYTIRTQEKKAPHLFLAPLYAAASLKNAMITSQEYKPLIGTILSTDPRGISTFYEYDSFGRLAAVRDQYLDLVTRHQYHYQNKTDLETVQERSLIPVLTNSSKSTKLELKWSTIPGQIYELQYCVNPFGSCSFQTLANNLLTGTYTNENFTTGSYAFRVIAKQGNKTYTSNQVDVFLSKDFLFNDKLPLTIVKGGNSVTLNWNIGAMGVAYEGPVTYSVLVAPTPQFGDFIPLDSWVTLISGLPTSSYTDYTPFAGNRTYLIQVDTKYWQATSEQQNISLPGGTGNPGDIGDGPGGGLIDDGPGGGIIILP